MNEWCRSEFMGHACEVPEPLHPPGPIGQVWVTPLTETVHGVEVLQTALPVLNQGNLEGHVTLLNYHEWTDGDESKATLGGVFHSVLAPDAFAVWTGWMPHGQLIFKGGKPLCLEVDHPPRHVRPIDPAHRGQLDADGMQHWFEPAQVAWLPTPERLDRPKCMIRRRGPLQRRLRRIVPMGLRDCCDFHSVDWGKASSTALGLLARAAQSDSSGYWSVLKIFQQEHLAKPRGERRHGMSDAVYSLALPAVHPNLGPGEGDYTNGRHRIVAMIDQGVHETMIERVASGHELTRKS